MIRKMIQKDTEQVYDMMKLFYQSPAVMIKAPEEILRKDIADCVGECPYVDGYIFQIENEIIGYSMVARGYSTEYGGECIWIEDLYIKDGYRGKNLSEQYFSFIENQYPSAVRFRLEVEEENEPAVCAYKKNGYHFVAYKEMSKEC